MKNENLEKTLEQALEHLMDSHIISYDKEIFYYLELKNYIGLEMLLDTSVKNHINIVGKSPSFKVKGNEKDFFRRILYSYIIANNCNKQIIEKDMIGKWIFEIYSKPTKDNGLDVTGKFTYIAELPSYSGCEAIEEFLKTSIDNFLFTRNRLSLFADTPVDEITFDLLAFPKSEFSDTEVFISPDFEKFLKDYKKGVE